MKESKIIARGRTMVEMLAVLAIIGILSLGGLLIYDMAVGSARGNHVLSAATRLSKIAQVKGQPVTNGTEGVKLPKNVLKMEAMLDGAVIVTAPGLSTETRQHLENLLGRSSVVPDSDNPNSVFYLLLNESKSTDSIKQWKLRQRF